MSTRYIGEDIGGYRVLEPIGSGGMAKVFKAYQPSFDRMVALKVLPEHYAEDATYLERFRQEAQIIARLEHRHILPVYDFGDDRGISYLTMRYLKGGTLKDVLAYAPDGRFSLGDVTRIIQQIGEALDYAHSQKIIHRDVKPSNVLVDASGDCYLMDFGIAKVLEATSHLTSTGSAIGTPAYMSPEQGAGKPVDGRTDQYALGIILYQLLTGHVPFDADTPYAIIIAHANDPLPLPSAINPDIPESVERVVFKALAKKPDDRFPTCLALVQALEEAVRTSGLNPDDIAASDDLLGVSAGLADTKPSDEVTRDVRIAAKRKPRKAGTVSFAVLAGAAVVVLALAAVSIYFFMQASDPQRALAVADNATATAQTFKNATATQARIGSYATRTQRAVSSHQTQTVVALTPTMPPTPTYTPTLTPTPPYLEGATLVDENFEDGVANNFNSFGSVRITTDDTGNRVLRLDGVAGNNTQTLMGSPDWTDYAVEFRVNIQAPGTNFQVGSILRFRDIGAQGCSFYAPQFNTVFGQVDVGYGRTSNFSDCRDSGHNIGVFLLESGKWYTIRTEIFEDMITVFADGVLVGKVEHVDPLISSGQPGLNVYDAGGVGLFDDVKVIELLNRP